jgi:toxin secretion/phage lysis holin
MIGWLDTQYPVITLMALMGLDIVFGLIAAYGARALNSAYTWRGMTKKAGVLVIIVAVKLIEALALKLRMPIESVPAAGWIAVFYCLWELLSIVENAARCGVPMPRSLRESLTQVKAMGEQQEAPKVQIVNTPEQPVPVSQAPAAEEV